METPINNEETVASTKEPVKAEEQPSSNSGERSDDAASPPPNCSICLGKLINTSFTDSCLHQFCFTCLLQWSRIKTECPLCKQTFKSIIHNVRSEEDYDQYHVPRETSAQATTATIEVNLAITRGMAAAMRRFAYRTTMTPRRYGLLSSGAQLSRSEPGPNSTSSVTTHEERQHRRNIYRTGEWSDPVPDFYSRFRECSAEYYRRYPHEIDRLIPWINRDLQTLCNANQPHIAYVLRVITELLTQYDMRSPEFRNALRPYFSIHTGHFIHELMNYARTDLTMTAYDDLITYLRNPGHGLSGGYWNRILSSSSNSNSSGSDDSDVRVVDHVDRVDVELPSVGPHLLSNPGPSTVSQTFQIEPTDNNLPFVLTISSSSSESECEIVGYVKPRSERTPEIIELASSDEEEAAVNNSNSSIIPNNSVPIVFTPRSPSPEPSTSHASTQETDRRTHKNRPKASSSRSITYSSSILQSSDSSSSDSDTDSDYNQTKPLKRSRRKKRTSKSSRDSAHKPTPKKIVSRKRNKYCVSSSDSNDSNNIEPKRRKTITSARWVSSSSSDDSAIQNHIKKAEKNEIMRVNKDLNVSMRKHAGLTIANSSSSTDSSSDSSSSSSTSSWSSSSCNSRYRKLKRKFVTRQRKDHFSKKNHQSKQSDENDRSKLRLKSAVIKVNSTVLRKDTNKKEWYVDNKTSSCSRSRSRSRSRSSYDSESDGRHRTAVDFREKRTAQKIANEKIRNESLYFMTDSQNDEESRSNSQCSGYSDRLKSNKHKNKNSSTKSKKSHKKSSKETKEKQKRLRSKPKRDKRHSSSSSC